MIRYEMMGVEDLANALKRKSQTDFKRVESKNLLQMRNRAVSTRDRSKGGTPVDTGELRLSAGVDISRGIFGYTKDYAPHVNFGHRVVIGGNVGYVHGQGFLGANVNMQQPIFKQDLINEMRKK